MINDEKKPVEAVLRLVKREVLVRAHFELEEAAMVGSYFDLHVNSRSCKKVECANHNLWPIL